MRAPSNSCAEPKNIHKRLLIQAAACNLALLLRSLYGAGKPKAAHDLKATAIFAFLRVMSDLPETERADKGCRPLSIPFIQCNHSIIVTFVVPQNWYFRPGLLEIPASE
jgi:hypothetical protein